MHVCGRRRQKERHVLEQPEADGTPLEFSGLLVSRLDDFLREVGESSSVEPVTFRTGAADELVEEGDGLLAGVLTFVLHHAGLEEKKDL